MVERKSGPVKPPVLDLEARKKTGAEKPNSTTDTKPKSTPGAAPTAKPKAGNPLPFSSREFTLIGTGAAAGILLSVALSYGIASLGYWPRASANGQTTTLDTKISALEQKISAISDNPIIVPAPETTSHIEALEQKLNDLTTTIVSVETRLAEQESRPTSAANATDLTPISAEITTLKSQLADLTNALEITKNLIKDAASKAEIIALEDRIANIEAQPTAPMPSDEPTELSRLPLALAGLETAFSSGRAYAAELTLISEVLPTLEIPDALANRAETGLPSPQAAIRAFEAKIPDLLAARPADPDMSWQDALLARAQALLAMRPTDDLTVNSPVADIARIEQALSIFDFKTAAGLSATLPEPMRIAGGTTLTDIEALAASADFAKAARTAALSPPTPVEAKP